MKKINKLALLAIFALGFFFFSGCKDVKLLKVEKTLDGGNVEFALAPQSSLDYDVAMDETMDVAELIKPYNLSLDQVKSLKMESAEVTIIDSTATPVTFDVTDNMSIEMGTTTIPMTKIAFKDPVLHTALTLLPLDIQQDVDLIPYAKANNINYHMKLKLNKALDHLVIMKLSVKWKVQGEI